MSLQVKKTNNLEISYPDSTAKSLPIVKTLEADSSLKRTGQKISFFIRKFLSEISCGMIYGEAKSHKLLKHVHFDSSNNKHINYYIIKSNQDEEAAESKLENFNYDKKDALIKKSKRVDELAKYSFGSIRTTSNPTDYDVIVTYDTVEKRDQGSTVNAAISTARELTAKRGEIEQKISELNDKIEELNEKIGHKHIGLKNYIKNLTLNLNSIIDFEKLNTIKAQIDTLFNEINSYKDHVIDSETRKFSEAINDIGSLPRTIETLQDKKAEYESKQEKLLKNTSDTCKFGILDRCIKGTKKLTEEKRLEELAELVRLEEEIDRLTEEILASETALGKAKIIVNNFFGEKLNVAIEELEKSI